MALSIEPGTTEVQAKLAELNLSSHGSQALLKSLEEAAIHQLPVETLHLIFQEYLKGCPRDYGLPTLEDDPDDELDDRDETFPGKQNELVGNPVLLSLVCRRWHGAARELQSLWTDVTFNAQLQHPGCQPCTSLKSAERILSRFNSIQAYPWTLHINAVPPQDEPRTEGADRAKLEPAIQKSAGVEGGSELAPTFDGIPVIPLPQLFAQYPMACATLVKLSVEAIQFAVGLRGVVFPNVTSVVIRGRPTKEMRAKREKHASAVWSEMNGYGKAVGRRDHLRDTGEGQEWKHRLDWTLEDLPALPALKHAVFKRIFRMDWEKVTIRPPQIPWSQITHLALRDIPRAQMRALLRVCVNLVQAIFKLIVRSWEESMHGDRGKGFTVKPMPSRMYGENTDLVVHTDLEELTCCHISAFADFIRISPTEGMCFPGLKKMRLFLDGPDLDGVRGLGWWDRRGSAHLFPSLTHLTIVKKELDGSEGSLGEVLDSVPTLEELFVRVTMNVQALLEYLRFDAVEGRYKLRRLRALGIRFAGLRVYGVEDEARVGLAMDRALQSRTEAVANNEFPAIQSIGLVGLRLFVLHGESAEQGGKSREAVQATLDRFLGDLVKYEKYGVRFAFGVRDGSGTKMFPKEGRSKRHWDEGYAEYLDGYESEYVL